MSSQSCMKALRLMAEARLGQDASRAKSRHLLNVKRTHCLILGQSGRNSAVSLISSRAGDLGRLAPLAGVATRDRRSLHYELFRQCLKVSVPWWKSKRAKCHSRR